MKRLLTYLILIIVASAAVGCRPNSTNDIETLNEVFGNAKIEFEMRDCGEWGCEERTVTFKRTGNGTYEVTGIDISKDKFITANQLAEIKEIVEKEINHKQVLPAICGGTTGYRIGNYWKSVEFTDKSCGTYDILDETFEN